MAKRRPKGDLLECQCRVCVTRDRAELVRYRALLRELVTARPNPTAGVVLLVPKDLVDRARAALGERGGGT